MNEAIENFFKEKIKDYEAIQLLAKKKLFGEKEKAVYESVLLDEIIDMMKNELFMQ